MCVVRSKSGPAARTSLPVIASASFVVVVIVVAVIVIMRGPPRRRHHRRRIVVSPPDVPPRRQHHRRPIVVSPPLVLQPGKHDGAGRSTIVVVVLVAANHRGRASSGALVDPAAFFYSVATFTAVAADKDNGDPSFVNPSHPAVAALFLANCRALSDDVSSSSLHQHRPHPSRG